MLQLSFLALGTGLVACTAAIEYCPPTGPVLPPPILSDAADFNVTPIHDALRRLVDEAPFNVTDTSFSVTVTTLEETIFQFHHTAEAFSSVGVSEVTGDTIYRIASVSKLFTVLSAMLQEGLDLDDFIWQHVPELEGVKTFEDITLRLLASHISGITRDGFVFDWSERGSPDLHALLGLPNEGFPDDYPICDAIGAAECTREQYLYGAIRGERIWEPAYTPTYSNYAFSILGLAIESFTNKTLAAVIEDDIAAPLGLTKTSLYNAALSDMIVPEGGEAWAEVNAHFWNPTGGVFSTPLDLSRFVRGVLNSELLTQAQTNAWLKPAAYTSSTTGNAVGMPWTIIRPINIARASGLRPIEIFTMMGSLPNYAAYVSVIPEYQVGITVNVAGSGDDPAVKALLDLAVQHVVPAFDILARTQAEKYVGTYQDTSKNEDIESSLILSLDGGPGLKVEEWLNNGKNVSEAWLALAGDAHNATDVEIRAYSVGGDGNHWQVAFRAITEKEETGIYQTACHTWFNFDEFRFQGLSVDQFDFVLNEDGGVQGLQVPGLYQNLTHIA